MERKINTIILTGFRATGKSLVGRALAAALGYAFVDTDLIISQREGALICDMVARHGWPYFRGLERQVLTECSNMRQTVVATGGGAIEHATEWAELRRCCYVVWLEAPAEVIYQRMQADEKTKEQRPRLTDNPPILEIQDVLARRTPMYAAGSDLQLATANHNAEELVVTITDHLRRAKLLGLAEHISSAQPLVQVRL